MSAEISVAPAAGPSGIAASLGETLVRSGKLASRDLERAQLASSELGKPLADVLVQLGLVSEVDVARARGASRIALAVGR